MSTRAISSQRNKRTNASNASNVPVSQKIQPDTKSHAPTGASNIRRELSVQEAFSLVNNRIGNLEKAVFDGDFTRPNATTTPPKRDEIEDIYKQLNELRHSISTPTPNPYTSINTVTSFDTINAELLMMKNDIMSTRSATQRIDHLNDDINTIKESIANISSTTNHDPHEKVSSIETNVSELKDIVIKLQNFTLEINDMCIKHMRTNAFDPFEMLRAGAQSDEDEHEGCIIIDHNTEEDPVEVVDMVDGDEISGLDINGISMIITETETDNETDNDNDNNIDIICDEPDIEPDIEPTVEPTVEPDDIPPILPEDPHPVEDTK
jgi:hypothetical protein